MQLDIIEIRNLQRQPYKAEDRGYPKAPALALQLIEQGHMVAGGVITTINAPFDEGFLETYDLSADCF